MTSEGAREREAGEHPFWLEIGSERVFSFLHVPDAGMRRDTAVLLCPPFGWEEMCSHRARRNWARALAEHGFATLRIDLPGSGESAGGPLDAGRLPAWTAAIASAARWLREDVGASRVAVIGIGVGGLAATVAVSEGAAIDDLILWGVPARGRTLLRELRAYAGIVSARYPDDDINPIPALGALPEGALEVTGFVMSAETAAGIEAINLTKLKIPNPGARRALLIGRDALGVDQRLQNHLESSGVAVTVLPATDFQLLMAHPQEARTPAETIRASIDWLGQDVDGGVADGLTSDLSLPARAAELTTMTVAGHEVAEMTLELRSDAGRTFAVLSSPVDRHPQPVCAVLLNPGALRRIGPNRTWVEAARRWAARGIPTVRVDFEGIGDSDGDERANSANASLYSQHMIDQTLDVIGQLADRGLPARFVLVGLCSGAYWALHAALADERVAAALTVNLYSFYWSEELVAARDRRETVAALRTGMLKRIAGGNLRAYHVRRAMRSVRPGRGRTGSVEADQASEVGLALDQLRDQGTEVLLALSGGEPLYDEFEREGRIINIGQWPNVTIERLPSQDHMVRAVWAQTLVHQHLDRSIERVIRRARAAGARPAAQPEPVAAPDKS